MQRFLDIARRRRISRHICFIGIALLVCVTFWPALFHVARADHWNFIVEAAPYDSWTSMIRDFHSYNRVRLLDQGDVVLFRPLMFALMCTEEYLFGWNFVWWQAVGIMLHLAAVYALLRLLWAIHRGLFAALLTLWFATMLVAQSAVTWQHINGYVLYMVFLLWTLYQMFRHQEEGQQHSWRLWAVTGLAFAAGLTHEAGNALGPVCAAYLWCVWPQGAGKPQMLARRWLLVLLVPVVLYGAWDMADFWWLHPTRIQIRTLGMGDMVRSFNLVSTMCTVVAVPILYLSAALLPTLYCPAYGATLRSRPVIWNVANSLSLHHTPQEWVVAGAIVLCLLVVACTMAFRVRAKARSLERTPSASGTGIAVVALVLLLVQLLLVAVGRANTRGLMTYVLRESGYYAYLIMPLLIVAAYAGCRAFGFDLLARLAGPRLRLVLAAALVSIALANAMKIYTVNENVCRQYPMLSNAAFSGVPKQELGKHYYCGFDPDYTNIMVLLAHAYIRDGARLAIRGGSPAEAAAKTATGCAISPTTTNFIRAIELIESKEPLGALDILNEPRAAEGVDPWLYCFEYSRASLDALDLCTAGIGREPANPAWYRIRAGLRYRIEDYRGALADVEQFRKLGGFVDQTSLDDLRRAAAGLILTSSPPQHSAPLEGY